MIFLSIINHQDIRQCQCHFPGDQNRAEPLKTEDLKIVMRKKPIIPTRKAGQYVF